MMITQQEICSNDNDNESNKLLFKESNNNNRRKRNKPIRYVFDIIFCLTHFNGGAKQCACVRVTILSRDDPRNNSL